MGRLADLEAKLAGKQLSYAEQVELVAICKNYRRMLAMKVAECAYVEMKNFVQIDAEIRPFGYRLVKIENSRIPVLEEVA